jgi:hypothetical protein
MKTTYRKPLAGFLPYVDELKQLTELGRKIEIDQARLAAALDGEPSKKLRELVGLTFLQNTGTFFSGTRFATSLTRTVSVTNSVRAIDPACGTGDLLIAFARKLPLARNFENTLEEWADRIGGCDLHSEFVEAAKLRLCLLIFERGLRPHKPIEVSRIFPNIVVADGLTFRSRIVPNIILMNPPYTWTQAPPGYLWGQGNICEAALFIDRWLSALQPGTLLRAILPDVLRTGAHYDRWRDHVRENARIGLVNVLGRFENSVDVDVFQLELQPKVGREQRVADPWQWYLPAKTRKVVGDYFIVSTGRVVPHRDKKRGVSRAYLHARNASQWGTVRRLTERVRTEHAPFSPPFVAVRRTSSPSDKQRAMATIVTGSRMVAVENHILILQPRTGSVYDCRMLLQVLRSPKTNEWLNQRIRCRHLTVSALRDLPWWES